MLLLCNTKDLIDMEEVRGQVVKKDEIGFKGEDSSPEEEETEVSQSRSNYFYPKIVEEPEGPRHWKVYNDNEFSRCVKG